MIDSFFCAEGEALEASPPRSELARPGKQKLSGSSGHDRAIHADVLVRRAVVRIEWRSRSA